MLKVNNGRIKDPYGNIVGFISNDRYVQHRTQNGKKEYADENYINGLSWSELEQISELLQKK